MVTSQLSACRTHKESIPSSYRGTLESFRPHTSFLFRSIRICLDFFLFLHIMSKYRFTNLCKHFDSNGLVERIHGNVKRKPSNTCTPAQLDDLAKFLDNIAESHVMPLPGRMPTHKDSRVLLLPTDMTKAKVFGLYTESCVRGHTKPVGRTKFHTVWNGVRPYIVTMKPADDLCMECQTHCRLLKNSGHLTEADKEQRLKAYIDHLELAKQERAHYNLQITNCRELALSQPSSLSPPVNQMHYSYDYAQQIHFPNNPLQPGPAYFLTARKCQIFGISCEPLGWQTNYLIDEADNVGKGANATISLLHHFLDNTAAPSPEIFLHADNCIGQNKNNASMQYLCWRVLTGRQERITISFMLSGHTKFAPDRHFGLIKKTYRRTRVDTMKCIQDVVNNSSHIGANKVQLIRSLTGEQLVHFHDWSSFFRQYFSSLPNITSFHVFHFDAKFPRKVFVQKTSSHPVEEHTILHPSTQLPFPPQLPDEIPTPGLTLERQKFLHDKIRQFCSSNLAAPVHHLHHW